MISFVLKKKEILEDKSESNTWVTIKVLLENDLMSKDNLSIFSSRSESSKCTFFLPVAYLFQIYKILDILISIFHLHYDHIISIFHPYFTIFYHILPYSTTFYHILPYSTIFYHILPYTTIFYHN